MASPRVFGSRPLSLVVIDNYDSFTYNLVQQIERLTGARLDVVRNDCFDPAALLARKPDAIVVSPGPGTPARAGRILDLIRLDEDVPLLGVCLGHQALGEAFGARIVRGAEPVHGKVTEVRHEGAGLFAGCPSPNRAGAGIAALIVSTSSPVRSNGCSRRRRTIDRAICFAYRSSP